MNYSLRIFTVFGIPVELHISFLILMIFIYAVAILNIFPVIGILDALLITLVFVTVVLHELGHSYVAQRYGIKIERIVLLPIGGVSALEEIPKNPSQELRIALAGPLVNFIIAGAVYIILILMGGWLSSSWESFLYYFILVNLVLGGFNLLPAYPMDGGRVLRALLAEKMSYIKATEWAASIGKVLAISMAIFGLFFNVLLIIVALFIYIGAEQEYKMIMVSTLLEGIKVKDIMSTPVKTLNPQETVQNVFNTMMREKHMGYPVTEDNQLKGIITFHDISPIPPEEQNQSINKIMTTEILVTKPQDLVVDALETMNKKNVGRLPVVENGELKGIISRSDIIMILDIMRKKKTG